VQKVSALLTHPHSHKEKTTGSPELLAVTFESALDMRWYSVAVRH
jgi:hypothetical protein